MTSKEELDRAIASVKKINTDLDKQLEEAVAAMGEPRDADRMQGYLYYADPCALFDRCKRCYSRNVALLHDYDLYEFTILVRKRP